jgi:hypothetical protein
MSVNKMAVSRVSDYSVRARWVMVVSATALAFLTTGILFGHAGIAG